MAKSKLPAVVEQRREYSSDPDYTVTMRVKNARFLQAMHRAGFYTIASLCRELGIHQTVLGRLVNLRLSPYDKRGEPTPTMQKVMDRIGGTIDDLFPPTFLQRARAMVDVTVELTEEQIENFLTQRSKTPDEWLLAAEAAGHIASSLSKIRPREERILRLHYGMNVPEHTFDEIGQQFDVTRERVRQIEKRGMRNLLHPKCLRRLKEAAEILNIGDFGIDRVAKQRDVFRQQNVMYRPYDIQPPPVEKPPPLPDEEAKRIRPIKFPPVTIDYKPAPQPPPLREDDYIRLLRIPANDRSIPVKRALAYHLERVFIARGAGEIRPANVETAAKLAALHPDQVIMAKYDWLIENLDALWKAFPPAPPL